MCYANSAAAATSVVYVISLWRSTELNREWMMAGSRRRLTSKYWHNSKNRHIMSFSSRSRAYYWTPVIISHKHLRPLKHECVCRHRKLWLVDFLSRCFSQTSLSPSASTVSGGGGALFVFGGLVCQTAGQSTAAPLCERRRQVCCWASGRRCRRAGCCRIGNCCRVRAHGERGRLL